MEYYIGMHNEFDKVKYERDFLENITGIEFCNFTSMGDVNEVWKLSQDAGFKLGVHFPFYKKNYKFRDPLLTSLSNVEKEEAYEAIRRELVLAKKVNAEYLLVHFPKPMVLSSDLNWGIAKFGDHEVITEQDITYDEFYEACEEAISKLSEYSKSYGVQIILEIELINKWIYATNLLETLLDKYNNIKVCLDSSRLHVVSKIDSEFDMSSFVQRMSKYTGNLHIANIQVQDKLQNGHYPALPLLKEEDGWCNIQEFLKPIKGSRSVQKVLFEHRSDLISLGELKECYSWVESLL